MRAKKLKKVLIILNFFALLSYNSFQTNTLVSRSPSEVSEISCFNVISQFVNLKHIDNSTEEVYSTLRDALKVIPSDRTPVEYIQVLNQKIPVHSKRSKWRAVVVSSENDFVSVNGYQSGQVRGERVLNNHTAKYNNSEGNVSYYLAGNKSIQVTAQEARALEFSYLDDLNPHSPKDRITVGVHDDPEKIIQLVSQSGAGLLLKEGYYIRLDEILIDNLQIISAKEIYEKFQLSHPNYSPDGEYVIDSSIPTENILGSYKFRSVEQSDSIQKFGFKIGDEVNYVSITGIDYSGTIASDIVKDGFVTLFYLTPSGEKKYDISHLSNISNNF